MLKKVFIICAFLIFSTFIIFSNCLFLGENVYSVKGGKSSGVILESINLPFSDFIGFYKQFDTSYDYNSLLNKYRAKLVCVEKLDGITNYYYYSNKLPKSESVKNKKVNIQIAISNNAVVVGTPIIYGSY